MDYDRLAYERLLREHPAAHDAHCTPEETRERYDKFVSARRISRQAAMPYDHPWFYRLSVELSKRGGDAILQAQAAVSEQHRLFMQCEMRRLRQLHLRDTVFMIDVTETTPVPRAEAKTMAAFDPLDGVTPEQLADSDDGFDWGDAKQEWGAPLDTLLPSSTRLGVWEKGAVRNFGPPDPRWLDVRVQKQQNYYKATEAQVQAALEDTKDGKARMFFKPYIDEDVSETHLRFAYNSLAVQAQRHDSAITAVAEFVAMDPVKDRPPQLPIRSQMNPASIDTAFSNGFLIPDMEKEYVHARARALVEFGNKNPTVPGETVDGWRINGIEVDTWSRASYAEFVAAPHGPWPKLRELALRGSWVGMAWLMARVSGSRLRTDRNTRNMLWTTWRICAGKHIVVPSKDEQAWAWWSSMNYITPAQLDLIAKNKTADGTPMELLRAAGPGTFHQAGPRVYDPTSKARDYLRIPKDAELKFDEREIWERGMPGVTQSRINSWLWALYASGVPKIMAVTAAAFGVSALVNEFVPPAAMKLAKFLFYLSRDVFDLWTTRGTAVLQSTHYAGRTDPRAVRAIAPLYWPLSEDEVVVYAKRDTLTLRFITREVDNTTMERDLVSLRAETTARVDAALRALAAATRPTGDSSATDNSWYAYLTFPASYVKEKATSGLQTLGVLAVPADELISQATRDRLLKDDDFLEKVVPQIQGVSIVRNYVGESIPVATGLPAKEFRAIMERAIKARYDYYENILNSDEWLAGANEEMKLAMAETFPAQNATARTPLEFSQRVLQSIEDKDWRARSSMDGFSTTDYDFRLSYLTELNDQLSPYAQEGPLTFSFYTNGTVRSPFAAGVATGLLNATTMGTVTRTRLALLGLQPELATGVTKLEEACAPWAAAVGHIQVQQRDPNVTDAQRRGMDLKETEEKTRRGELALIKPTSDVGRFLDTWLPRQGELPVQEVWGFLVLARTFVNPETVLSNYGPLRKINYILFEATARIRWYAQHPPLSLLTQHRSDLLVQAEILGQAVRSETPIEGALLALTASGLYNLLIDYLEGLQLRYTVYRAAAADAGEQTWMDWFWGRMRVSIVRFTALSAAAVFTYTVRIRPAAVGYSFIYALSEFMPLGGYFLRGLAATAASWQNKAVTWLLNAWLTYTNGAIISGDSVSVLQSVTGIVAAVALAGFIIPWLRRRGGPLVPVAVGLQTLVYFLAPDHYLMNAYYWLTVVAPATMNEDITEWPRVLMDSKLIHWLIGDTGTINKIPRPPESTTFLAGAEPGVPLTPALETPRTALSQIAPSQPLVLQFVDAAEEEQLVDFLHRRIVPLPKDGGSGGTTDDGGLS
jgi:hypothetical protein